MDVYRLCQTGSNTITGWQPSAQTPYNSTAIDTITDPNGAQPDREITSVPSPFARIALVKAAFEEINKQCNGKTDNKLRQVLDGNTIYHKMVSDSLDVGEIFFNYSKFKNKIDIICWNPQTLFNSTNNPTLPAGQRCYADALHTYWQADGDKFNFGKVQNIYILNLKQGPATLNIIGATSPATLFFSNANPISYVGQQIQFVTDKPFDNAFQPLYKRDPKYFEYLWYLKCSFPNFAILFPEVDKYLEYSFAAIDQLTGAQQKANLQAIQNSPTAQPAGFAPIPANAGNNVELFGHLLLEKVPGLTGVCDFTIKSTKQPGSKCLVLPIEAGTKYAQWHYTTDNWGSTSCAPAYDPKPLDQRTLPFDGTKHPYLTVSDFLTETILSSPNKLNGKLFYHAGPTEGETSYLLPLKPLFFEYFSADDLASDKMLTLDNIAGGNILATLRIPTVKGIVEYQRLYTPADADITNNQGTISNNNSGMDEFDVCITPAVATPQGVTTYYTVAAISDFAWRMKLHFFKDGEKVEPYDTPQIRNENFQSLPRTTVYTLRECFESIEVETSSGSSMAVPTLPSVPGNKQISFAVDLGTSNTHVEYTIDGDTRHIEPLSYGKDENMRGLLFEPVFTVLAGQRTMNHLRDALEILESDIMPEVLGGKGSDYSLPTRTALAFKTAFDWTKDTSPLEISNPCLTYGKLTPKQYSSYATNIKWSSDPDANEQLKHYIRGILLILRNKAITLGTNLGTTRLTWFYPTSMRTNQRDRLQYAWDEEFKQIFGGNATSACMCESIAPVAFHHAATPAAKDMLTIDIGGGTTDVAFASGDDVKCVTSFRFASNALFEDSFSRVAQDNGIIEHFKSEYQKVLNLDNGSELSSIYTKMSQNPADLAAWFFDLANVPCVKRLNPSASKIDFIQLLRNDSDFKLEFVTFFAAILWHVGKIIKTEGLPLPRHIALSGNGSKVLQVLASPSTNGSRLLAEFAKRVLEEASSSEYAEGAELGILGFYGDTSPKAATCRGGLLRQDEKTETPRETVLLCSDTVLTKEDKKAYDSITEKQVEQAAADALDFFKALREIDKKFSFADNFDISDKSWQVLDEILNAKNDIVTYVQNGIEARKKENSEAGVAETLFFYPIASILQRYSLDMEEQLTSQQ